MELFTINNLNARDDKLGELQLPHLSALSSGQRNHSSLNLHIKIEEHFNYFTINKVNKNSITTVCAAKNCKTTHKFKLDKKLIKIEQMLSKIEKNFVINFSSILEICR